MRVRVLTATLAVSVLAAGCANNQDAGTAIGAVTGGIIGNQFGKGGGKVASTLAGAVIGGIVGNEIGRSLDARDRELARQAEYDAWERGPPRQPVRWRNPDNGRYGEIVADLAHSYSGTLELSRSKHGGLSARLTLPSAT